MDFDADDQKVILQTLDYYHERLLKTPVALEYLHKRGITDEAIEYFKLGFADRTLGLRLPSKQTAQGAQIRERLQRIGLLRESSGHEHFNGCVVFPIFDCSEHGRMGDVTEIYGRKIGSRLRKGTAYHLYLPGPHKGVFNFNCLKSPALNESNRQVILCESIIDALTFWCNGFQNVTCIYGCEGFTDELFDALIENKVQRVYLAYDNDKAGNRAASRDSERLCGVGIECYRVKFPVDMDANRYALNMQPACTELGRSVSKALDTLIKSAQWLSPSPKSSGAAGDCASSTITSSNLTAINVNCSEPLESSEPLEVNEIAAQSSAEAVKKNKSLVVEQSGDDYTITIGSRIYRIRGLHKNSSLEVLKINLKLTINSCPGSDSSQSDGLFHLDELNLYQSKQRERFIAVAAAETTLKPELIKRDLGKLLFELEAIQEKRIAEALKPKAPEITLCDDDRLAAERLLKDRKLLDRILFDFERCGIVGESMNKLAGYIATISRKLDKPLAVIIQSTSAAGKSTLMESVLSFLPEEEQIKYSAMTGQSLYYLGETNLKHKVLAIVEEEGAERASYALKLLQSEGELTIASTGKDATTGRMETQEYHVGGPVMIFLTTTAIDIDEELMNRCLVLTVDEGREQTQAIHRLQREAETFAGLKRKHERSEILKLHRNAQRLLKPLAVVNPYAPHLKFNSERTRARRDHMKYLTLIKTVTLLHQYQREVKACDGLEYIEVTLEDIESANCIAHEVLGRTLDELPPQTRRFLILLKHMVEEACTHKQLESGDYRFNQRQAREYSSWSDYQVRTHLGKLVQLEYLAVYPGTGGIRFEYELLYDGDGSGKPHLIGLLDIEELKTYDYDAATEHSKQPTEHRECSTEGLPSMDRAPTEHALRVAKNAKNIEKSRLDDDLAVESA